jgi:hypothetical protein
MNNTNDQWSDRGKKVTGGVASAVEIAFEVLTGLVSGLAGVFFSLIGWGIGILIFVVLAIIGLNFIRNTDFSGISENLQSGIEGITEGIAVEGWVSEVDSKIKVPTEEEIAQARQAYDEKAARYKENSNSGKSYPFEFQPPEERQVTIVTFRDKRSKEFKGISPKSIPLQRYVRIKYNSWTDTISNVEIVEQTDPLFDVVEPQVEEPVEETAQRNADE